MGVGGSNNNNTAANFKFEFFPELLELIYFIFLKFQLTTTSWYKNITAVCDEVFYECWLLQMGHEIFYQLCQIT